VRRCPYCDEEIRDEAVKCKHCGSILVDTARVFSPADTLNMSHW